MQLAELSPGKCYGMMRIKMSPTERVTKVLREIAKELADLANVSGFTKHRYDMDPYGVVMPRWENIEAACTYLTDLGFSGDAIRLRGAAGRVEDRFIAIDASPHLEADDFTLPALSDAANEAAAICNELLSDLLGTAPAPKAPKRRRRQSLQRTTLTEKQIEAILLFGECHGNVAEVARRLGKDYSTVDEALKTSFKKLGKTPAKYLTQNLKRDARGQTDLAYEDDRRRL